MGALDELANLFVQKSREIFDKNLVGIYLHGSAVMGCFNAEKSDIDIIIVVNEAVPDGTKRRFMDAVVELNALAPKKRAGAECCQKGCLQAVCLPDAV